MPDLPRRRGWRQWLPRCPRDINKREQMLMMLGLIWILIGLSTLETTGSRPMTILHEHLPTSVRGYLWIGTGLIAIASAWRPPGLKDTFGWTALYVMPTLRVISYLLAWAASWDGIPLVNWAFTDAYPNGWRFAAIYLAQSLTVIICSGWPNPIDTVRLSRKERKDRKEVLDGL